MATINGTNFNDNNTVQFNGVEDEFFPSLEGTGGDDEIFGFNGTDILNGHNGSDSLNGGPGADEMDGGDQDDTYFVDNVGDVAAETFNDATGGVDTVNSTVSHTLGFGIEHLTLTGGGAINGTGNGNDNFIIGNAAANVLNGGSGSDTLLGQGGNDNLNGGAGFDNMQGGSGNDTYTVDNASDTVTEAGGAGTDLVNSSISYTLLANVENLTLTGGAAINGTGNTLNNTILGNNAANTLAGGGGNDTLHGNAGNDTLNGGSGTDTLLGQAGTDFLIGGTGSDLFRFTAVGESVVGAGHDTISGFDAVGAVLQDRVDVNAIDANTAVAGNQNFAFISTAAFSAAGQIRVFNSGGNTIIQGNVNANLAADFEILVQDGGAVAANWVAGDFFL